SLGVIVEATFKVLPLPAREEILCSEGTSRALVQQIIASPMTPTVLDLYDDKLVLAFAGVAEEVDWQLKQAAQLADFKASNLACHREFWSRSPAPWKVSVL